MLSRTIPHPSLSSSHQVRTLQGPRNRDRGPPLTSLWNPEILCPNSPEPTSRSLSAPLAWVWDADVTSRVKLPQRVETPRPEGPQRVHSQPRLSMVFPLPLHRHRQPVLHRLVVCGPIWGVAGWGWGARAPDQKSSCRQQCKFHHFPDGPCERER